MSSPSISLETVVKKYFEIPSNRSSRSEKISTIFRQMGWKERSSWLNLFGLIPLFRRWKVGKVLDRLEGQQKIAQLSNLVSRVWRQNAGKEALLEEPEFFGFTESEIDQVVAVVKKAQSEGIDKADLVKVHSWDSFVKASRTLLLQGHPVESHVQQIEQMNPSRLEAILKRVEAGGAVDRRGEPLLRAFLVLQVNPIDPAALSDRVRNALDRFARAFQGVRKTLTRAQGMRLDPTFADQEVERLQRKIEEPKEDLLTSVERRIGCRMDDVVTFVQNKDENEDENDLRRENVQDQMKKTLPQVLAHILLDSTSAPNEALGQLFENEEPSPVHVSPKGEHQLQVQRTGENQVLIEHTVTAPFKSTRDENESSSRLTSRTLYTAEFKNGQWTLTNAAFLPCVGLSIAAHPKKLAPRRIASSEDRPIAPKLTWDANKRQLVLRVVKP